MAYKGIQLHEIQDLLYAAGDVLFDDMSDNVDRTNLEPSATVAHVT